ncbi:MAG: DUF4177 domain-containing protein [Proteobacteria bacterium]|nr:DUF4177 domain-containing protein [Pseudomonadota bacterium]
MKWEYAVEPMIIDMDEFGIALNEYGEDGWELVAAVPHGREGSTLATIILKRPKGNDPSN